MSGAMKRASSIWNMPKEFKARSAPASNGAIRRDRCEKRPRSGDLCETVAPRVAERRHQWLEPQRVQRPPGRLSTQNARDRALCHLDVERVHRHHRVEDPPQAGHGEHPEVRRVVVGFVGGDGVCHGRIAQLDPAVFKRSELLYNLFPVDWDPRVPSSSYGGSALVWNYYAHQPGRAATETNYIFQQVEETAPVGARLVTQDEGAALYVQNEETWARHLALRPPTPAGSPIFQIPRGIIFRSVPLADGLPIIDVVEVASRSGLPMDAFLNKLGVKR